LSDAVAEAEDVGRYFPLAQKLIDREASISNIERALPHASIFHFAGHAGVVAGRRGLLLFPSGRRQKPAVLDSANLETVPVLNLRLAVLSACSTENSSNGTALAAESLVRGFLRRGVPHVVATHWNVDSAASRMLMQFFYKALVSGQSVPQSLAIAQASVRAVEPHPYYWAGFSAFGNP
jgi:CHAT domain-containing protein